MLKVPLLPCSIWFGAHTLTIEFIVCEEAFLHEPIRVPEPTLSVEQVVREATLLYLAVYVHELGLTVQQVVLVQAHIEDFLANVAAISVETVFTMLVKYHLTLEG